MNFDDNPEEAAFRQEARTWLEANARLLREGETNQGFESDDDDDSIAAAQAWQAKKASAGWACITWPMQYGGREATPIQSVIWDQEESRFHVPANVFAIGLGMAGPTLMAHGSDEQKTRWLAKMLRGEEWRSAGCRADRARARRGRDARRRGSPACSDRARCVPTRAR